MYRILCMGYSEDLQSLQAGGVHSGWRGTERLGWNVWERTCAEELNSRPQGGSRARCL